MRVLSGKSGAPNVISCGRERVSKGDCGQIIEERHFEFELGGVGRTLSRRDANNAPLKRLL